MRGVTGKFLYKLILYSLVISTFPVLALGLFSYVNSSESVKENVKSEKMNSLYQVQMNIEQSLKAVEAATANFLNSALFKEAAESPLSPDQFRLAERLSRHLRQLQSLDSGIADIAIANYKESWVMNNSGLYYMEEVERKAEYLKYYRDDEADAEWIVEASNFFDPIGSSRHACSHSAYLIYKYPLIQTQERSGMIVVNVPVCTITSQYSFDPDSEEIFVLDKHGNIVIHNDASFIGRPSPVFGLIRQAVSKDGRAGQFDASLEDERAIVTYRTSDYNGWTYVSVVSVGEITKQSGQIGLVTISICLAILAICITAAWIVSRKLYTPIGALYASALESVANTLKDPSQGNEIEWIGKQFQSLKKRKEDLEYELRGQLQQLRNYYVMLLIQGDLGNIDIPKKFSSLGFPTGWRQHCAMVLQVDDWDRTRIAEDEYELLMFAVNNVIGDVIDARNRLPPIIYHGLQVTVLGTEEDDPETFMREAARQAEAAQKTLASVLKVRVSIGVSRPFRDLSDAHRAYKEGVEALKIRIKLDNEAIIFHSQLNPSSRLPAAYPQHIENKIVECMLSADADGAVRHIEDFIKAVTVKDSHPDDFQLSIIRLLVSLLRTLQDLRISLPPRTEGPLFEQLLHKKTADNVANWFRDAVIAPTIRNLENKRESKLKSLSEQIVKLIEERYDTDLTLESCAAQLNYNANYLSSVFKKEKNISFSEYLSNYRLKMSKKYLIESDMTIREIAERLRFTNSQNFIRAFRKAEGITPGKFREIYSSRGQRRERAKGD